MENRMLGAFSLIILQMVVFPVPDGAERMIILPSFFFMAVFGKWKLTFEAFDIEAGSETEAETQLQVKFSKWIPGLFNVHQDLIERLWVLGCLDKMTSHVYDLINILNKDRALLFAGPTSGA